MYDILAYVRILTKGRDFPFPLRRHGSDLTFSWMEWMCKTWMGLRLDGNLKEVSSTRDGKTEWAVTLESKVKQLN